jgi:hypothetical protein
MAATTKEIIELRLRPEEQRKFFQAAKYLTNFGIIDPVTWNFCENTHQIFHILGLEILINETESPNLPQIAQLMNDIPEEVKQFYNLIIKPFLTLYNSRETQDEVLTEIPKEEREYAALEQERNALLLGKPLITHLMEFKKNYEEYCISTKNKEQARSELCSLCRDQVSFYDEQDLETMKMEIEGKDFDISIKRDSHSKAPKSVQALAKLDGAIKHEVEVRQKASETFLNLKIKKEKLEKFKKLEQKAEKQVELSHKKTVQKGKDIVFILLTQLNQLSHEETVEELRQTVNTYRSLGVATVTPTPTTRSLDVTAITPTSPATTRSRERRK